MEYVGGDGEEEPPYDGGVDGDPLGVVGHGEEVDGPVDMVQEIILVEEEVEVGLSCVEVGCGSGELDGDAFMDRDVTDDGRRGTGEGVATAGPRGGEGVAALLSP